MLERFDEPAPPLPDPGSAAGPGLRFGLSGPAPIKRSPGRSERRPIRNRRLIRRFSLSLRGGIFCIDWVLRRCYGVYEFSADQDDLLRAAIHLATQDIVLPDGARIAAGDTILDLHIWNERMLSVGQAGSSLAWAIRVRRRIDRSLSNLAACMRAEPSLQSCKAPRAETVFAAGRDAAIALRIAARFGLTLKGARAASVGESLVGFGLAWACNPRSVRNKPFRRARNELWISRAAFLERYGAQAAGGESPGPSRQKHGAG